MESGLQTLNSQQKLTLWGKRVADCRSSGLSVAAWCSENGVSTASYYKWQSKLYHLSAPQFVELNRKPKAAVAVLHIGDAEVEISSGIDEETLTTICLVLKKC